MSLAPLARVVHTLISSNEFSVRCSWKKDEWHAVGASLSADAHPQAFQIVLRDDVNFKIQVFFHNGGIIKQKMKHEQVEAVDFLTVKFYILEFPNPSVTICL